MPPVWNDQVVGFLVNKRGTRIEVSRFDSESENWLCVVLTGERQVRDFDKRDGFSYEPVVRPVRDRILELRPGTMFRLRNKLSHDRYFVKMSENVVFETTKPESPSWYDFTSAPRLFGSWANGTELTILMKKELR